MPNRHDRRKAVKIARLELMSWERFKALPSGCAWDGCQRTTHDPDGAGWSKMLLYKGETQLNFNAIDNRDVTRDCILCPEHATYFDEHLLRDIGRRLVQVMGTA